MNGGVVWLTLATAAIIGLAAIPRKAGLQLKCLAVTMALIVLVPFDGSVGAEYDAGGNPALAMAKVMEARQRGEEVAIRGTCNSSCALKLAAGRNLCVSPQSEIGVHEVRRVSRPGDYGAGVRDDLWTGFFEGMLPACARDLFSARHAFTSGTLIVVSGSEILRACPMIRACAPQ